MRRRLLSEPGLLLGFRGRRSRVVVFSSLWWWLNIPVKRRAGEKQREREREREREEIASAKS